jgi:hypothetical protein
MSERNDDAATCAGCFVAILAIALIIAAVMSIAALVDPFDWMPPVGEIFEDCTDDPDTDADECELATRYPGFWLHVVVNFAYAVAALVAVVVLAGTAFDLREARTERFKGPHALEQYREARGAFALAAAAVAALAVIPFVAAVA